jgi:dTDP-4-amino-4,6-dideoxygalactose transaminase
MSDINAAVLLAQLEFAETIQQRRRDAFNLYIDELKSWSVSIGATLPTHLHSDNRPFHLFPILMPTLEARTQLIDHAKSNDVSLTFHYVPLHNSPGGAKFGRSSDDFSNTETISNTLVRLPLFSDMKPSDPIKVLEVLNSFVNS